VQTPSGGGRSLHADPRPETGDNTLRGYAIRRKRRDVLPRRPMGGLSVERIDAQRGLRPPLSPQP
jgi:hypothetical protein